MNREEAEQRARECGAILSIGDPRDRRYAATTAPREELPDRFDLTSDRSAVHARCARISGSKRRWTTTG